MLSQIVKDENDSCRIKEIESPSHLVGDDAKACPHPLEEIEWITCHKCRSEIGIPFALRERLIECPGCGLRVKLSETILFRPAAPAVPSPAPPTPALQPEVHKQPAAPSVYLLQRAQSTFNWGVASIVLGWTILVPLTAICCYIEDVAQAKEENTLVPGKASIGLALSLLFGVAQGAAVIAKLNH